jgi:glycosyltransferase involved in cell wall biosynthesis
MNTPPFNRSNFLYEHGSFVSDQCICVIVTLYNYETYICECLDSIHSQTYPSLELVVIDDHSYDGSVPMVINWIERFKHRFQRVRFVSHLHNRGLAMARNSGLGLADSAFVFIMDADNILFPAALTKLHRVISSTGASAAYSQLQHFGEEVCLGTADVFRREFLSTGNYIDAMALFDKASLLSIGGYNEMSGWEDFDVWCRFIEVGLEAVFLPSILCRYRVHGTSMLRTETSQDQQGLIARMLLRHPWLTLV